jgi:hypothetical protein
VADQITALHKILEQSYDSNEEPQIYYKSVQDAKNSLESLNEIIDESTLIRHGLNHFKEHINLKADVKAWKNLSRTGKTWKQFKLLFTKAINENKSDTGTLKAIGIANSVKEQVNQNKENQRILAQATVEANDKIEQLRKQQAQLYAALKAKQPPSAPLQDTTTATIKALTDSQVEETDVDVDSTEKQAYRASHPMEKMVPYQLEDGIMITTVGHMDLISSIPVKHANISKTQSITRRKQPQPL